MSYKTYENYEDSGIEWIGEIPEHWECRKINSLAFVRRGASPRPIDDPIYFDDNGVYSWVRISNVTSSNKYLDKTDEKLSSLGKSLSVPIEPGNIFVSIAGTVGKPIIANIKCCIHDGFVYFNNLKINDGFLFYVFEGKQAYKGLGKLGTQLNLNTETIGKIHIPVPSEKEQTLIENFLDRKTSEIDKNIAKNKELISLLDEKKVALINHAVTKGLDPDVPMKDSGIEWIGEIPEHWDMMKISNLFNNIGSGTTPKSSNEEYYTQGSVNWLITGDLNDDYIYETSTQINIKALYDISSLKIYSKDSLVIAMYGATIGKLGILKVDACTNQACCVLSDSYSIDIKYAFYWFLGYRRNIVSLSYGGGQPNISQDVIKNLKIILPSVNEQNQIVDHLNMEIAKIDNTIDKVRENINLLNEYKTSLIHHVVTGKIDVRDENEYKH